MKATIIPTLERDAMVEALQGALVVISLMERPENCGDKVNAAIDRRVAAIHAALANAGVVP